MKVIIAVLISSVVSSRFVPAQETWCWAPDVHTRGDCIYSLKQCEEIVRLRRAKVCHQPGVTFSVAQ